MKNTPFFSKVPIIILILILLSLLIKVTVDSTHLKQSNLRLEKQLNGLQNRVGELDQDIQNQSETKLETNQFQKETNEDVSNLQEQIDEQIRKEEYIRECKTLWSRNNPSYCDKFR